MVAPWLLLLPHSNKDLATAGAGPFWVESACSLLSCVGSLWVFWLPSTIQRHGWHDHSKLSLGVAVNGCLGYMSALSTYRLMSADKQFQIMDGWILLCHVLLSTSSLFIFLLLILSASPWCVSTGSNYACLSPDLKADGFRCWLIYVTFYRNFLFWLKWTDFDHDWFWMLRLFTEYMLYGWSGDLISHIYIISGTQ